MGFGGFSPSPQYGGQSSDSMYELFLDALNKADGTALDTEVGSFNYAENVATARMLADLWESNARLKNQFDPNRMTDFLPRWEAILGIIPAPDETMVQRRNAVAAKISSYGKSPTAQVVNDLLTLMLDDVFVKPVYYFTNDGNPSNPLTGDPNNYSYVFGQVQGGITVPGGVTLPDGGIGSWSSSICYVAYLMQQPATMTDDAFEARVSKLDGLLEDLLPAWTTFNWVINNSDGYGGFILDDPHNLDGEYFDP